MKAKMTSEDKRLADLIESGELITFYEVADKEYPGLTWTVYGAVGTNEIIARASVSGRNFLPPNQVH